MSKMFMRFKTSTWARSFFVVLLIILNWGIWGYLFQNRFFDDHLSFFRVINGRGDVLTYATVILAVQIPLFILLLEKMYGAGHIRRLILPGVVQFREVLVTYITLSFLMIVAPRYSFLYFPAAMIAITSLLSVFEAVRVLFEPRKVKPQEDAFVARMLRQELSRALNLRVTANNFFEKVKKLKFVSHTLLDFGTDDKTAKKVKIVSHKAGFVKDVDLDQLDELMAEKFSNVKETKRKTKEKDQTQAPAKLAHLKLSVRPGTTVRPEDTLATVVIPTGYDVPNKRFQNRISKCIELVDDHPDSAAKQLDDMLNDCKQQLHNAIVEDDPVAIQAPINFCRLLNEGFDDFSKKNITADSGYKLMDARNEFRSFDSDNVSHQLREIADLINEGLMLAVRSNKSEVVDELVSFAYRDLLAVTEKYHVLPAARADQSTFMPILRLLFADDKNLENSEYRDEILVKMLDHAREHAGLLLYNYRHDEGHSEATSIELEDWLTARLDDMRSVLLAAHKTGNSTVFKAALKIADEFEKDYRYDSEELEKITFRERCVTFMVAAHLFDRPNDNAEQKKCWETIVKELEKLSAQDITRILVACVDRSYAEKWSMDTYDLVADGEMHWVPDFGEKAKSLWIELMLRKGSWPPETASYDEEVIAKTMTFTDGLSNDSQAFLVKHLDELASSNPLTQQLKLLVEKFIGLRRQFEKDKVIASPLSKKLTEGFKRDVLKAFREESILSSVFLKTNAASFNVKWQSGFKSLGWNQIYEKEAFIDDWHIGWHMQGDQHGREIALAQKRAVTSEMLQKHTKVNSIDEWVQLLKNDKKTKWIVFLVGIGPWYLEHNSDIAKYVKRDRNTKELRFRGIGQQIPIEHVYNDSLPKGLYAITHEDIGKLRVVQSRKSPVEVDLLAYSHDDKTLEAILKAPPAWLKDKGNKDEQRAFLLTKIRMLINHSYKYEPSQESKVYYFPISREY